MFQSPVTIQDYVENCNPKKLNDVKYESYCFSASNITSSYLSIFESECCGSCIESYCDNDGLSQSLRVQALLPTTPKIVQLWESESKCLENFSEIKIEEKEVSYFLNCGKLY